MATKVRAKVVEIPATVDQLLDRDQVAKSIGVSLRTFTEMRSKGGFPEPDMVIMGCNSPRWRVSTFNRWDAKNKGAAHGMGG